MAPTPRRESVFTYLNRAVADQRKAAVFAGSRTYEQVETWHEIGEDSNSFWETGWGNAPGYGPVQFLLDPVGFVHMRGVFVRSSGATGLVFNIPSDLGNSGYFKVFCENVAPGTGKGVGVMQVTGPTALITPPFTVGSTYRVHMGNPTWLRPSLQ